MTPRGVSRKPTREDRDRWAATSPRAGRPSAPVSAVDLVGGPCDCSGRPVGASTRALIIGGDGGRHRYVRSGPATFDYVGSW